MGFGFYCLLDDESTKRYGEIRTKRELEHGFAIVVDKKKELEEIRLAQKQVQKKIQLRNNALMNHLKVTIMKMMVVKMLIVQTLILFLLMPMVRKSR